MAKSTVSAKLTKARYWECCLYPENMRPDWERVIADVIQVPSCYCVHDRDVLHDDKFFDESHERKTHVHLILCFPNTTTASAAIQLCNLLSLHDCRCCSTAIQVMFIRGAYNYLIHDTDTARAAGKFQYDPLCRISLNNFDIGNFEQISNDEKSERRRLISAWCIECSFTNYADLYQAVCSSMYSDNPSLDEDIVIGYSAHFERLCRGVYLRIKSNIDN